MKKIFLLSISLFLFVNHIEANKLIGYYITNANDTVRVLFNIPYSLFMQEPNFESLQRKIKYYDSNNKKNILMPDMAKEVVFEFDGIIYRMLSRNDDLGLNGLFSNSNKIFLLLVKEGKVKLFEYHFTSAGTGGFMVGAGGMMTPAAGIGSTPASKFILQKGDAPLFEMNSGWWLSFRDDMANYFNDCPDLVKKIIEKVYRKRDIEQIVDEYNFNCK